MSEPCQNCPADAQHYLCEFCMQDCDTAYRASGAEEMKKRIIKLIKETKWHPGGATGAVNPNRIIEAIEGLE